MIAYLLLVHSNPKHLQRLIARLQSDNARFFIHVDKKADRAAFAHLRAANVTLVDDPVAVHWGDFSQVEAIERLMRTALASGPCERLVLLSGVDYPVRPTADIEAFFARHPTDEFINMVAMPSAAAGKPLTRLTTYKVRPTLPALHSIALRLLLKAGLMPRQRDLGRALGTLTPYGGSTWWALTRPACEYALDVIDRRPDLVRFFKGTEYADETFLHTILGNSPFRDHVKRNFTYTDWSAGGASPANISAAHLPYFAANTSFGPGGAYGDGPIIFARKFTDADAALLQQLDARMQALVPG
jgi:hypothetical protein